MNRESATPEIFVPLSQAPADVFPRIVFVRHSGDPSTVERVRQLYTTTFDDLAAVTVQEVSSLADTQTTKWRLGRALFGGYGAMALLLSSVGLFMTLSFAVIQQRAEITLRMALGATPALVMLAFGRRIGIVIAGGIAIGLALASAGTMFTGNVLFGGQDQPPAPFLLAALSTLVAGVVGAVVPIVRASLLNPVDALKGD